MDVRILCAADSWVPLQGSFKLPELLAGLQSGRHQFALGAALVLSLWAEAGHGLCSAGEAVAGPGV